MADSPSESASRNPTSSALRSVGAGISRVGNSIGQGVTSQTNRVVRATLDDLHDLMPLLEACGFEFGGIELELAMSPSISVRVHRTTGEPSDLDAILQDNTNLSRTQRTIISSLRQAYALEDTVMGAHFRIIDVRIRLGVPPSVSLILGPLRGEVSVSGRSDAASARASQPPSSRSADAPTPRAEVARVAPEPPYRTSAPRSVAANRVSTRASVDPDEIKEISLFGVTLGLLAIGVTLFLAAAVVLAVLD